MTVPKLLCGEIKPGSIAMSYAKVFGRPERSAQGLIDEKLVGC